MIHFCGVVKISSLEPPRPPPPEDGKRGVPPGIFNLGKQSTQVLNTKRP